VSENPQVPIRKEFQDAYRKDFSTYTIGIDKGIGRDYTRHTLLARDGTLDFCGGTGLCKWCDREKV
jgi:hypothetical protein